MNCPKCKKTCIQERCEYFAYKGKENTSEPDYKSVVEELTRYHKLPSKRK